MNKMNKKELVEFLVKNYTNEHGEVDLSGLDFGDNIVWLSEMKAQTIYQNFHQAKEIFQSYHKADEIWQLGHEAYEVYQGWNKINKIWQDELEGEED